MDHVRHVRVREDDHGQLLKLLAQDSACEPYQALLHRWIQAERWDGHEIERVHRGIPQGSPISPILANYFLTPLDHALVEVDHRVLRAFGAAVITSYSAVVR